MPLKIVKGDIYRVSRKTYAVLRSFLDSSLYGNLPWNIGVKVDADTVEFRKPGRWALIVSKNLVLLLDANSYPVLRAEISNTTISLKLEEYTFTAKLTDLTELLNIYVYNDEVEYATPLSLYAIAHKVLYYYRNTLR
jgi:hypothetical protein